MTETALVYSGVSRIFNDYWIRDLSLANKGERTLGETLRDMPGLSALERRYANKKPLQGARITVCVTVTYETAAFVLLLEKLGAKVRVCPDNPNGSIDAAAALIASHGIPVFAKRRMTEEELLWSFEQAIKFRGKDGNLVGPNLVVDDGCDMTRYLHDKHPEVYKEVVGTSEQTTCGINALYDLKRRKKLRTAAIDVNDSLKARFDNIYGSRESLIEGLQKCMNKQLGGKKVVIFGYGWTGQGCAMAMRGFGANVSIVESNSIRAGVAIMDGFSVLSKKEACKVGDIFITATGCIKTINGSDIKIMKDGAILGNMGHGNMEIDTHYLNTNPCLKKEKINEFMDGYTYPNGKSVYLLCRGRLVNMDAGKGHPPRVMSITFTLHTLALIELWNNPIKYKKGKIYRLPKRFDEEAALLNFPELQGKLVKLTREQNKYLGITKIQV